MLTEPSHRADDVGYHNEPVGAVETCCAVCGLREHEHEQVFNLMVHDSRFLQLLQCTDERLEATVRPLR